MTEEFINVTFAYNGQEHTFQVLPSHFANLKPPATVFGMLQERAQEEVVKLVDWSFNYGHFKECAEQIEAKLKATATPDTTHWMTASEAYDLRKGAKVRILVDGCGEGDSCELENFKAGELVTVNDVTRDNDGVAVVVVAENGVSNTFDEDDYSGRFPFEHPDVAVEMQIARKIVQDARAQGYVVSVRDDIDDGGEWVIKRSGDLAAIIATLRTTCGDTLFFEKFEKAGKMRGLVILIWGNGYDVIHDHTDTPEVGAILAGAEALAQKLEEADPEVQAHAANVRRQTLAETKRQLDKLPIASGDRLMRLARAETNDLPDNADRVTWAEEALNAFTAVCSTDEECAPRDLICNLMHLMDARGMNTLEELKMAVGVWKDEQRYPEAPGPCNERVDVEVSVTINGVNADSVPITKETEDEE